MSYTPYLIFIVLLVVAGIFVVTIYNRLVAGRNAYKNSFAQIDVQLTRRYDLIPNLVEVAKKYLSHERETLEAVIMARNQAAGGLKAAMDGMNSGDMSALAALGQSEGALSGMLSRLMVTVEAYPELKADANMRQLSEEIASTENRVGFARQAFNDEVMFYNNNREMFPNNLIAGIFSFTEAKLLEIQDVSMRDSVKISI
ncbi:hypothetical protein AwWohl_04840 [Gammaproteobacteria bacterium]|nr:hypothetical protein AwWohl_04840 [Gammaproteobacteria bacterium]